MTSLFNYVMMTRKLPPPIGYAQCEHCKCLCVVDELKGHTHSCSRDRERMEYVPAMSPPILAAPFNYQD
ncbi:hypothetical protein CJU90_3999 [Yarrowia sp. C11]|nr:hypothetical protein CKK34_5611 [Yarrowia sp. E02]KAG5367694.1 hypothetical protein CJU90_3999 [Yarrowia sp. C11]